MRKILKPLLAALVLAGAGQGAQAAYLGYESHSAYGAYTALTPGDPVDDALLDLSAPPSDLTLFGARNFSTVLDGGAIDHGYAGDAFLQFTDTGTDLSMSLSQFLTVRADAALGGISHQQDAAVDLAAVTMRIMGDAGEAAGTPVMVRFTGNAGALDDFSSVASAGYLTLGLSVSRGSEVLGEFFRDVQSSGDLPIGFDFAGNVGDALTLSAFVLSGTALSDAVFAAAATPYPVAESLGTISGSFAVAAVPEPESIAMLLAGLGVIAMQLRRRRQSR